MNFDLRRSLRRFREARRKSRLTRCDGDALQFVDGEAAVGRGLLLDSCVYIDVLRDRVPEEVAALLTTRICNHSGIALAELSYLFGRLDPRHPQTRRVLHEISGVILDIPVHRLNAPSLRAQAEAGILAGFAARLAGIHAGARQGLLNDAMLYLQAIEQGHALLTRNIRDFDWFEQLLPSGRALFYRAV